MSEKILFLARKLKKFTIDDIAILTEISEAEILTVLKKLIKKGIIQKTKSGYILSFKEKMGTQKPLQKTKNEDFKFSPSNFAVPKQVKKPKIKRVNLDKLPEYNRKEAEKSLRQLELTRGLHGEHLKSFIQRYNEQNPKSTLAYSSICHKRRTFAIYGTAGLVGKYGKTLGFRHSPTKYYEFFKTLYLTPDRHSIDKCLDEIARYFGISKDELPSRTTYCRWLHREFTKQQIQERRELCL